MMEVPQLHGFGPAANRLLEAYNTLLKVLFECLIHLLVALLLIFKFLVHLWPTCHSVII
jgi:hypothetical protein